MIRAEIVTDAQTALGQTLDTVQFKHYVGAICAVLEAWLGHIISVQYAGRSLRDLSLTTGLDLLVVDYRGTARAQRVLVRPGLLMARMWAEERPETLVLLWNPATGAAYNEACGAWGALGNVLVRGAGGEQVLCTKLRTWLGQGYLEERAVAAS